MSRPRRRPVQVAVVGGGSCGPRVGRLARALGRELAAGGAVVVCGGLGGVMEAVARGAAETGGTVLGLLPGYDARRGNRHLTLVVPTGLGHARNVLVASAGDVLVALAGAEGTRAEVAFARLFGRPVVVLGAWRDVPGVVRARTPGEAARRALALGRRARGERAAGQSRRGDGVPVPPRRSRLRRSGMALIRSGRSRSQ